jgi:mono/diheme cytochrome c family protein
MHIKYSVLIIVAVALLFASCSTQTTEQLFTVNQLPAQMFEIDPNNDTTVKTKYGAIIHIPAHALSSAGNAKVKFEFKEAYSIADIIKGGLTTMSGEVILKSAGMFSMNGVGGEKLKYNAPVEISIPSDAIVEGMKLYKGKVKADGKIDWIDPAPLKDKKVPEAISAGAAIFNQNCSSCHSPYKDATGPPLAFVTKRRDWQWLKAFTRNSAKLIATHEGYACHIYHAYNHAQMTAFPDIDDSTLKHIFEYADYEASRLGYIKEMFTDWGAIYDSCETIKAAIYRLELEKYGMRLAELKAIDDSLSRALGTKNDTDARLQASSWVASSGTTYYYNVLISAEGWYNLDMPNDSLPGSQLVAITAKINISTISNPSIYLVVPSEKIFASVPNTSNDRGIIDISGGKLKLTIGTRAMLIAYAESGSKLLFGQSSFIVEEKVTVPIELVPSSEKEMEEKLKQAQLEKLTTKVSKSKNFKQTEKIDSSIERLYSLLQRYCGCDCSAHDTMSPRSEAPPK